MTVRYDFIVDVISAYCISFKFIAFFSQTFFTRFSVERGDFFNSFKMQLSVERIAIWFISTVSEIEEVILAVKPSIEGETTSLYISKLLENKPVKVSKIAHGVPIGVDMEYIDSLTLELALEDRTEVS